jgi:hypothetical protein
VRAIAREQVSLEGIVDRHLDHHVLLLRGDEPVPVVHDGKVLVAVGTRIAVTGYIDHLVPGAVGGELGISVSADVAGDLAGRSCIVATELDVRSGGGPAS